MHLHCRPAADFHRHTAYQFLDRQIGIRPKPTLRRLRPVPEPKLAFWLGICRTGELLITAKLTEACLRVRAGSLVRILDCSSQAPSSAWFPGRSNFTAPLSPASLQLPCCRALRSRTPGPPSFSSMNFSHPPRGCRSKEAPASNAGAKLGLKEMEQCATVSCAGAR